MKLRVWWPSPYLNLVPPGVLGLQHLAADRGRRLFASARPCAQRAIHVMEAGETGFQAKILAEVPAHPFAE